MERTWGPPRKTKKNSGGATANANTAIFHGIEGKEKGRLRQLQSLQTSEKGNFRAQGKKKHSAQPMTTVQGKTAKGGVIRQEVSRKKKQKGLPEKVVDGRRRNLETPKCASVVGETGGPDIKKVRAADKENVYRKIRPGDGEGGVVKDSH